MNKIKLSWSKYFRTVLSLGFLALGIGCISWAVFTMWGQPDYSAATPSNDSFPGAFAAETNTIKGNSIVLTEPDPAPALPASEKILYPVYPEEGNKIGILTIPALKLELPVLQGTGADVLKQAVGHFGQSVLPGEDDNCVLSGHRETVFRQLGSLVMGDQLIIQTVAGIFTYEINGIRIVHAEDKTVIVPTEHAVLTMTTCYPFNTPGYFPDRYIVSATLVKSE